MRKEMNVSAKEILIRYYMNIYEPYKRILYCEDVCGVMVIARGNEHGDLRWNPGRGCFHFA